ncbi:PleD family two-component system response regulator [Jiella sp. MQZ9-1]|uniref:diguanylate cyclase n=1 Tax=Jiella flava TaxID=2816857 RepID=A0A939JVN2_9HYPH|nr:PleD family two-component system response regulator [Jiella flava]MBO0662644.1 PleD family two-component system response regulator [Jiella flava]MCD2471066.1 PleD family two-component system response regulator [Jiella flava]
MSARILVVDDIEVNRRLLAARLGAEYYEVSCAESGEAALAVLDAKPIDIVLLDVMMPGLDGFEVCRRIKASPRHAHVPVVLITALDQPEDRLIGLEAGADDFLTKPVADLPLMARLRSLTRLKRATDELRTRAETAMQLVGGEADMLRQLTDAPAHTLVFTMAAEEGRQITRRLRGESQINVFADPEVFLDSAAKSAPDVLIVDLAAEDDGPLRLISKLRAGEATRLMPILVLSAADDEAGAARALELGANDYVARPIDRNELAARLRTQLRRKRYDEGLRRSLQDTIELAVRDPLTGLHNRRFLDSRLFRAQQRAADGLEGFALALLDIDHFKRINDGFGHDAGDAVLTEFAARLTTTVRGSDLVCRFGGEEFAVLMPGADLQTAGQIAERIRQTIEALPFAIAGELLAVTVSAGVAAAGAGTEEHRETMLKRADAALYAAKRAGRNRVGTAEAA